MSKYAAVSLSEALEPEMEGTNVGVTVLCPSPINTNIARGARNRPDHKGGPQIRVTFLRGMPQPGAKVRHSPQYGCKRSAVTHRLLWGIKSGCHQA